jgi:hypothetical protein
MAKLVYTLHQSLDGHVDHVDHMPLAPGHALAVLSLVFVVSALCCPQPSQET